MGTLLSPLRVQKIPQIPARARGPGAHDKQQAKKKATKGNKPSQRTSLSASRVEGSAAQSAPITFDSLDLFWELDGC